MLYNNKNSIYKLETAFNLFHKWIVLFFFGQICPRISLIHVSKFRIFTKILQTAWPPVFLCLLCRRAYASPLTESVCLVYSQICNLVPASSHTHTHSGMCTCTHARTHGCLVLEQKCGGAWKWSYEVFYTYEVEKSNCKVNVGIWILKCFWQSTKSKFLLVSK